MRRSLPTTGVTEKHSLHETVRDHSATNHGTSLDHGKASE
jgi:hypothetical protein